MTIEEVLRYVLTNEPLMVRSRLREVPGEARRAFENAKVFEGRLELGRHDYEDFRITIGEHVLLDEILELEHRRVRVTVEALD